MKPALQTPVTLILLVVLLAPAALSAASPRDELLRYVPEDVGFCLVVQDLRGRFADVADSPFAQRAARSPLGKALLASAEWAKVKKAEEYLSRHLGVSWTNLRDDLLGDAFLFAYRPGPAGKPEQEQGLFLLRARQEKALTAFVARLNALQQDTGELKSLDEREHNGVRYVRRQEATTTNFYLLRGPVLLFTGQEALLREAIDLHRKTAADAALPLARRLRDLKLDEATVALAVNPRAWDDALTAGAADPSGRMALACWKAVQGIGVSVEVEKDVRLRLSLRVKTADLPPAAQRFLAAARRPSELWANFPENALLAAAGRLDLSALADFLGESMSQTVRRAAEAELDRTIGALVGKSVLKELLPALGPDWGVCLTAPPAEAKGWTPALTVALKVARGDEADPTDEAVLSALLSWVRLAVLGHNKSHPDRPLSLRATLVDGVRGRFLHGDGVFPEGVQPGLALKAGYLVLASSPGELRRFRGGTATEAGDMPLLRLSLKDWRAYLEARRDQLAEAMAGRNHLTKEQALAKITEIHAGLELLDRIELRQSASPQFASFTLTVVPSAPLRK